MQTRLPVRRPIALGSELGVPPTVAGPESAATDLVEGWGRNSYSSTPGTCYPHVKAVVAGLERQARK